MALTKADYANVYAKINTYSSLTVETIESKLSQVPAVEVPNPPRSVTLADHNFVFNVMKAAPDFGLSIQAYEYVDDETGEVYTGSHAIAVELGLWDSQVDEMIDGIGAMYALYLSDRDET